MGVLVWLSTGGQANDFETVVVTDSNASLSEMHPTWGGGLGRDLIRGMVAVPEGLLVYTPDPDATLVLIPYENAAINCT